MMVIKMTKTLFSVLKSPYNHPWRTLVKLIQTTLKIKDEVGILLLQDAVYAAKKAPKNPLSDIKGVTIYASAEDLKARGLDQDLLDNVTKVTAADVIDLVGEKYEKIVSWN
jgi:sulfur relay protein TusB/DsrH